VFTRPKKSSKLRAIWSIEPSDAKKKWAFREVMEAFNFLLDHAFFSNAFGIVRQIIGLSMGAPHSPPTANLALAAAEVKYVDRTLELLGSQRVRKDLYNFSSCCRYIDDLASETDNVPTADDYYGMEIVKVESVPPSMSIGYLSFQFTLAPNRRDPLTLQLKDKQQVFPILLIRYPSHFSTVPDNVKAGTVVGGLVSIYRFIEIPQLFREAVEHFFDILRARRYSISLVRRGVQLFLQRNCRQEFFTYMYQQFFAYDLLTWPYKSDVSARIVITDEQRRMMKKEQTPYAWAIKRPQQPSTPAHQTQHSQDFETPSTWLSSYDSSCITQRLSDYSMTSSQPEASMGSPVGDRAH